jgi:hypothetical protein
VALPAEYGRYGYRRITAMLRADGWRVNAKRVQQSEAMPRTAVRGAEGAAAAAEARPPVAERRLLQPAGAVLARHVWAYDFVQDRTHDGRLFRMLTVIGEFTRECLPSRSPATSPRMTWCRAGLAAAPQIRRPRTGCSTLGTAAPTVLLHRCALLHVEGLWAEGLAIVKGWLLHKRVDESGGGAVGGHVARAPVRGFLAFAVAGEADAVGSRANRRSGCKRSTPTAHRTDEV